MNAAKSLIAILEGRNSSEKNIKSIIESAYKNKVLLHILRALNLQGRLRENQESAIKKTTRFVQVLSELLEGYDYSFFKLVRPIAYVPADVDILIKLQQANKVAKEIMKLGYRITVKDPYCLTLTKGESVIDLYVHPSIGGVVFINGQQLLGHSSVKEFNEVKVRSLESYAEALVAASHAIYKERIYTLNDFFTVEKWITKKTFRLAQELSCEIALKVALNLNRKIRLDQIETPYKIPFTTWLTILIQKFQNDKLARTTSINMLKTLTSKRAGKLLASKLTKETY